MPHLVVMRCGLSILLVMLGSPLWAQRSGTVLNADDGSPLPYCAVGIAGTYRGTITNAEGVYRIDAVPDDTLLFSYVGFERLQVPVAQLPSDGIVRLTPLAQELGEVEVFAEDDALYDLLLAAARQLRRDGRQEARVLFELFSQVDSLPTEVIEAHYNGTFDGPAVLDLGLKNGRIGIAPVDGRYFVSLNTTKAFAKLDVRERDPLFPASPFALRNRALKRAFALRMMAVLRGDERRFRVGFEAREAGGFSGGPWCDSTGTRIDRIRLSCTDCRPQPFRPLFAGPVIEGVDLTLELDFQQADDRNLLDLATMDYTLLYRLEDGRKRRVSTEAVMHAYDRGNPWFLPLFDMPADQPDYRQITFLPYEPDFWVKDPGLVATARRDSALAFLARHGTLIGHAVKGVLARGGRFFQDNYIVWNDTSRLRIAEHLRQRDTTDRDALAKDATVPRLLQVDLQAQLFLDANEQEDGGYAVRTATVLDVFRTRYDLEPGPATDAFLNIWFDLCELERRKLQREVEVPGLSADQVRTLHAQRMADLEQLTRRYCRETDLGDDRAALQRWNDRVKDALGTDNLALFPPADTGE